MNKKPVIIDCDPGLDDAIALVLALSEESLDVKCITTSAGNQTPEKTLNNALKVLSFIGKDLEVAQGAGKPILKDLVIAGDIHGESGLGGTELPEATLKKSNRSAIEAIVDILNKSDEKVTIIATGPLTNIGILLVSHPEIKDKIERITLMGGACFGGNKTPAAEFNIYVDPEAANIVFNSGIPIVMCGLDVTSKAQMFKKEINDMRNIENKVGVMVADILDFYSSTTTPHFLSDGTKEEGPHLHDVCAVAYEIDPTLFITKKCNVVVETSGEYTKGSTVVDYNGVTDRVKNTEVVFDLDRKRFIDMLFNAVKKYNE